MENDGPKAAKVYEKFLGFPEKKNVASQFYQHCINIFDNLSSPQKIGTSEIKVLSIGTGYGRADFPLLKAYIKQYEKLALDRRLSFVVDCVDSSSNFQNMLGKALENDRAHYRIFFENPRFFEDMNKKTFQASGKSASGKSKVVINGYCKTLTEFLSEMFKANDGSKPIFHCIIAILSLQYTKHLKTTFPRLLEKLRHSGIIVIGETCAEGAWLSKPPPIWVPKTKSNSRWYRLWTDWHNALYKKGINRRIRLFMPDNFQLLVDSLESSGFISVIPSKKSEFTWPKTVTSECFSKVTELIKTGDWKKCVSSLHLYNQDLGKDSPEDSGKKACVVNILKSGEWQNKTNTNYRNGIRLYVYRNGNEKLLNYENYKQTLQKVVLKNSERTIREQGISRHIRAEKIIKEKSRENRLIQLVQSLIQHVEIDNGCFIIGLSVSYSHTSTCAIGGALTPCSKVSIDKGKASEFYEKLNLSESDAKTYQRVWLWLYTLYLALAKRPSAVADRLYRIFELNSAFDCTVDMYAERETLDVSRRGISIELKRDRMKAVRETVWNSLEKLTDKKREVAKWEKESKVVRALEHFWGKNSPLVQALRPGSMGNMHNSIQEKTNVEHSDALPEVFDTDPEQPIEFSNAQIEDLFDKAAFQNIKHNIDDTFKNWAEDNSEPGIHAILERMFVSPIEKTEPIPLCTDIFYQFYLFSLFLHEKDLNYIFHVPAMEFNSVGVWGGFQIFMDKEEYSFFKATGHSDLSDIFYKFISPFDIILLRDTVSPALEKTKTEEVQRDRARKYADRSGHEEGRLYQGVLNLITSSYPDCLFDSQNVTHPEFDRLLCLIIESTLHYGLIWASYSNLSLPLKSRPWTNSVSNNGSKVKDYMKELNLYGWRIALLRELGLHFSDSWKKFPEDTIKNIIELFQFGPQHSSPNVTINIADEKRFNDFKSIRFTNIEPKVSYDLFRWIVAAMSNTWQHCIPKNGKDSSGKGGNSELDSLNRRLAVLKNKDTFNKITIDVKTDSDDESCSIIICNEIDDDEDCQAYNGNSFDKGTGLTLLLVAEELWKEDVPEENIKDFLKFGLQTNMKKIWETSIRLKGISLFSS